MSGNYSQKQHYQHLEGISNHCCHFPGQLQSQTTCSPSDIPPSSEIENNLEIIKSSEIMISRFIRQKVKVGCPPNSKTLKWRGKMTTYIVFHMMSENCFKIQNLHLLFTPFFPFRSFLYCSFSLLISPWSTSQTSAVGDRSSLSTCNILLKEK